MIMADLSKSSVQNSYQENEILTAGREELILMLYNGAIKFINHGLSAFDEKDWAALGWNLVRAQKIVHYLDLCLDMDKGQELAKNLDSLYHFILRRLSQGNLEKKKKFIEEGLGLLRTMRDAWDDGVVKSKVLA
jgi:flagellar protein FliS